MSFQLSVNVTNVGSRPIAKANVHVGSTALVTDDKGQTPVVVGNASQTISVDHPDFVSASSNVAINSEGTGLKIDSDPLQISSTQWYKNGTDFTVQVWFILGQLDDVAGYSPSDYFFIKPSWAMRTPQSSSNVLGTASAGWDRFLSNRVTTALSSQGQYFAASWKNKSGAYSPQLVSIWLPNACVPMMTSAKQHGGPSYLLYFTPTIPSGISDTYPTGDFYRHLGDRYLFSEKMTAHHMAAQGRAGVIVVPIGQHGQSFTDIASRSGALRLLREVSHFVRRKAKVAIATHFVQDVFSVAVAGFSDGGDALFGVLTNAGGDADADYFYGRALREVYHLDCDPKDTSAYVAAISAWYANASGATGMRNYRFYTAKGWAAALGTFSGTSHTVGAASERHDSTRSFVSVGAGHIQPVIDAMNAAKTSSGALPGHPALDVEPNIPADSHHFFPYFFVGHAIGHSDIF